MEFPLTGDRIALRPFETSDAAAMHAIYADASVMRWVGEGPVSDLSATEAMLRDYMTQQQAHGFSCWAVVDRATGMVIGDAGLYSRNDAVELGYTLASAYWGRGYGTEAASLCVAAAFGPLGLPALMAFVRPENAASVSVLMKLGFRPMGEQIAYGANHLLYRRER